jgi:hypothetical protein
MNTRGCAREEGRVELHKACCIRVVEVKGREGRRG